MSIGKIIERYRHLRKMTIRELAKASGVSTSRISEIETERTKNPQFNTVKKLVKALKIPYEIIFEDSETE